MRHEDNIEDLDDPIRLFDCSNLLDAGIIETASSEKAVQRNLKYKLSLKSCYMLPVSFFDIPRNIVLLNECQPIRVTIVDYYKHPWYFKNNMRQSCESNETDSTIHIDSDDDDSDIICLDSIDEIDKIPSKMSCASRNTDIIDLTSRDQSSNEKIATFLDKRRKTINGKLDLELRKALSQKHSTDIDIKRNKGLIGMKITRRITVDDIAQDTNNNVESNNDHKNEEGNKISTSINDTETYVKSVDKVLERMGTVITPILEEKDGNVTSTVNNNLLETKPQSSNKNKPNIKCQLTNVPPTILEKFLKLKETPEAVENKEQTTLNKSVHNLKENEDKCMTIFNKVHIIGSKLNNNLKTSESPSSLISNKCEKTNFCQAEKSNNHKNEQPKQRPMPKCKKLLENLRNKSKEIKENSFDRHDDKSCKKREREISGIISPILPCNSASKKNVFKSLPKPNIINEPKKNHTSRNVFEIHKHNIKECRDKKTLNINTNPRIKTPRKNIKPKPSSCENKTDISNEKIPLKLNNSESTEMQCKETAIQKECSEIAQQLLQSIINHEINTQNKCNETVRKQNFQNITSKVDSNKVELITSKGQTNGKDKSTPNNELKSDSKENLANSRERKVKIVSVENVKDSSENMNNNVKAVMAQHNKVNYTHPLNSAVQNPETSVLQRPLSTKTPYQHNTVSENIPNLNTNFGNNTPSKIPVINNHASAIILRPQLFHTLHTNGQPIQTYTSCRPQYPKATKYPTLDKLLSKINTQAMYRVPHLPPNRHFLPPNQNDYQCHNFVRHPSPYYGVAPNRAPVQGPAFSKSFGGPNPNPYWNYGCPVVPPPPPPPPVRENYNPNILTDIQPNDNSSIIGKNVNGLVKKINIITTSTPPLQPEHDTKEGIVKLELTSPQNISETTGNSNCGVLKTVSSVTEKPVGTKSEMLEELERSLRESCLKRIDLKRPHLEYSVTGADQQAPALANKVGPLSKKMKPCLLPTPSTKHTVTISRKGYSPPILPIPTYQNFLSQVNSTKQNYNVEKPKDILRNPVTPCIRQTSTMKPSYKKKRLNYDKECPTDERPAKKISIADYKKRSSPDTSCVVLSHKIKQRGNGNAKSVLKVYTQSKHQQRCNSNLVTPGRQLSHDLR